MTNETVAAGVGKIIAAAKSISTRYATKKLTNVLAVDRKLIEAGLKAIEGVDVPLVITSSKPSVPALPGAPLTSTKIPLGMYWIGQPSGQTFADMYQDTDNIAAMALRKTVIINGWPELEGQRSVSNQSIAAAIKAASDVDSKVFVYFDTERVYKSGYTSNYATRQAKIAAENWYVYATGTSGTAKDSYFGTNGYAINPTIYVPDDSSSRNAMEWMADYEASWIHGGAESNASAADIDGVFWDNTLLRPRQSGDWNRDGTGDTSSDTTVAGWYREGIASGVSRYKTNNSTRKALGNLAEFPNAPGWLGGFGNLTHYDGLFHGGVLEHICGQSYSPETWMTTAEWVAAIQGTEDAIIDPSLAIFNACPDDYSETNYRLMRHSLAACLVVSNMCFGWCLDTETQSDWPWYDEFDFELGAASESRRTSAESNGIWRRDYENGIVLWNPRGNTGTISLGGTFYRLRGTQDATTNSAAAVTSVTFSTARDGLILSRTPT